MILGMVPLVSAFGIGGKPWILVSGMRIPRGGVFGFLPFEIRTMTSSKK